MPKGGPEWLASGGAGTDGPYLLSPYTHTPSELARSLARALLPKNSPVPESREFSPRRILYKRQGVGTRGAGAGEGGARTEPPAGCSKRRARQGRADVSRRLAKPRRAQRRAGKRGGRASLYSPAPPGQAGPAGAAGAGSHRRPPRSKPVAPPSPSRLAPLLPAPVVPAALPGPALVVTYALGTPLLATACTERWNLSPGSRRLLASRQLPKLRQPGSPGREKGALGSGCH